MQKQLLLLLVAIGMAMPAFSQHKRRVMVEEFTQASCGPCASANPAFNATLSTNDEFVTSIKYQTSWPGFDPMNLQNPTDVQNRVDYYDVGGVPDGYENGATNFYPGGYTTANVETAYNNLTPVTITLSHTVSSDLDSVYVSVSVTSDAALSGNLRLHVGVTEQEIKFGTAPGTNGEKEFYNVMRKLLPNADGQETGDFTAGETKAYQYAWKLQNIYNLNNIETVAWLQDDASKEVWQSAESDPNTNLNDAGVTATISTANAYKINCNQTFAPVFSMKNTGTAPITNAVISYAPYGTYDWTGSLAPGASTSVTLPEITFTNPGLNTINIVVQSTNNGQQLNQNAKGLVTVNAFYTNTASNASSGFEGAAFPPASWGLKNDPNSNEGWHEIQDISFNGGEKSATIDFFNISAGKTYELIVEKVNLTNVTAATMSFDYAHTFYDATYKNDRLRIDVSTNCGVNWQNIWDKQGDALATTPPVTVFFVPTADDWANVQLDLTSVLGQADVLVRFRGTSAFGNNLYLDNVNLSITSGVTTLTSLAAMQVTPNPANEEATVRFGLTNSENITVSIVRADGTTAVVKQLGNLGAGEYNERLDVSNLPSGLYRVVLQSENGVAHKALSVVK